MTHEHLHNAPHFLQSFKPIAEKIQQIKRLNEWFKIAVNPLLAQPCQVGNYRDGCLVLIAENASVATQVRLKTPDLLIMARQHPELRALKTIQCKVMTPASPEPIPTKPPLLLSKQGAQAILESASTLKDEQLRRIMERIAKRSAE